MSNKKMRCGVAAVEALRAAGPCQAAVARPEPPPPRGLHGRPSDGGGFGQDSPFLSF